MDEVFAVVELAFEALGVAVLVIGLVIAVVLGIRSLLRGEGGQQAFQVVRTTFGGAILLGLEVLVASDLIRTLGDPSPQDALVLGLIVLIRTILSWSIQVEIEGALPWRRAALTSGAQVMARQVRRDRDAAGAASAGATADD
ncbi:DUF1622 domain-containing protein [Microbacterium mangrovi]|nr:DUF1622 domain-containing protein [Microbacterium mangrovi]